MAAISSREAAGMVSPCWLWSASWSRTAGTEQRQGIHHELSRHTSVPMTEHFHQVALSAGTHQFCNLACRGKVCGGHGQGWGGWGASLTCPGCIHSFAITHSFTQSFIHSVTHPSLTHSCSHSSLTLTHYSCRHSFPHSLTHFMQPLIPPLSLTHSFLHSFGHLFTHSFSRRTQD